jgi:SWIM zinc finger
MPDDMARWSAAQVLALAPDPFAQRAGQSLGTAGPWRETGYAAELATVWGLCQGSGRNPYQTCVDLTEPAYRCSCPSRKLPCKHALGLLLLWSAGGVNSAEPPTWVADWRASRSERKVKAEQRSEVRATQTPDPAAAVATQTRRMRRVDAGMAELERWLTDQVRQGLAGASRAGYGHWDTMAARLVDAQAPGAAGAVRRLAAAAGTPERLLAEMGLLWLLVRAYRRLDEIPPALAATVRSRIGFTVSTEEVFASPRVHDDWAVIGVRDELDDRLSVRRVWLRGAASGRFALVLSFAAGGAALPADLILGTSVEADLCFYPGAQPLRALVAHRYGEPGVVHEPGGSATVADALSDYASAVAAEPWLERWPMVLRNMVPAPTDGGLLLRDNTGAALPLDLPSPWRLLAAAGGGPCTLAGVWSAGGLRPLAAWVDGTVVWL